MNKFKVADRPYKNMVSFTNQPTKWSERLALILPFGDLGSNHIRPYNAPAYSKAVKFQELWFWGWN